MIIDFVLVGLGVAAAGGVGYAFYKHITLTQLKADVKTVSGKLDAFALKVAADAKTDYASVVAELKALVADVKAKV